MNGAIITAGGVKRNARDLFLARVECSRLLLFRPRWARKSLVNSLGIKPPGKILDSRLLLCNYPNAEILSAYYYGNNSKQIR